VQLWSQQPPLRRRAVVLTGRHPVSDTEVQLYQRVLQQMNYEVQLSRYAETSSFLRTNHGVSGWSLLLCLSSAERSCLRRVSFSHLQHHQMVNLLPVVTEVFSDAGGGLCDFFARSHLTGSELPMRPYACGSSNQKLQIPEDSTGVDRHPPVRAPPSTLVAMVNVYVLVTSVSPLTAFLHDISVVMTNQEQRGRATKLGNFLLQQLGPAASHEALRQVKKVIGDVLQAAMSTNEKPPTLHRCVLCYQLLTFTLLFTHSVSPVVIQVDTDVTFLSLSDDTFDGQITKDLILEDTLHFLLLSHTHLSSETHTHLSSETHTHLSSETHTHLSEDEFLLLLQFQQQMKTASAFELVNKRLNNAGLMRQTNQPIRLCHHMMKLKVHVWTPTSDRSTPTPPLTLTPPFSPWVKEYRAEVTFDTVMVRIRPEPISSACRIHLDEHRGPRMANYPVGLGNSKISILVTDDAELEPVVMTIYTVHMYRESRPILPMFGDHVMCSFLQDCGLQVQPGRSCGLQPFIESQNSFQTCSSGHEPGRWVVPCLSCSDNRTCDWREVAWQPDGCYHPLVDRPLLQDCMTDRKVLFIGDSTNRGMMYFLMERVNSSLEDWGKAHDLLVYRNLNLGRTLVSYSYYPQFWLEKKLRPTFRQALMQLLNRSRPLLNSNRTVLVVGGVQWLNTAHLRTVREVLHRESLSEVLVLVKSLGMGFHLPVDGIRSLSLKAIQELYRENQNIITTAKHYGYEVIDTFSITMGRYKEFLQGRCACHFHEVEKLWSSTVSTTNRTRTTRTGPGLSSQSAVLDTDQEAWPKALSYHVRGPVNQVYSEILLSRLCSRTRKTEDNSL
ncbi:Cadherin-like and PC-esterase domain-containing protein 1, partial [Larimichthys crocea]